MKAILYVHKRKLNKKNMFYFFVSQQGMSSKIDGELIQHITFLLKDREILNAQPASYRLLRFYQLGQNTPGIVSLCI